MEPQEEWKHVPGFSDYLVSDTGRVVSLKGRSPRELGGSLVGGYRAIMLYAPGLRRYVCIHRLVARAFLGEPPVGMEVRHLDGDSLNNALSNLRYGTHAENVQDQLLHGTHPQASKSHCKNGHEFSEPNTWTDAAGGRWCRACGRARQRAYMTRKALKAANVPGAAAAA